MTVRRVLSALRSGEISAESLIQNCLDNIDRRAELNNFISLMGGASEAAQRSDERIKSGKSLPLDGLTFAVKDNVEVAGERTTCASRALFDYTSRSDADIVVRLKALGAVLVGKTNMDEFAMGSTNEYSAFGGVKNALDTDRVPGGSSGGSANAVAAGQVAFAIGSDTGGSVRQPAAFCGVVGLKPTFGAIRTDGLMGLSPSLDTYGIFAADCDGARIVFDALCGNADNKGEATGVADLKIGIVDEYETSPVEKGVSDAYRRALDALKAMGAEIVRISIPSVKAALSAYHVISSAEAANSFFDRFGGVDKTLLGGEVKRRLIIGRTVVSGDNYENLYIKAAKVRAVIKREFNAALDKCDVILSPTTPTVATPIKQLRSPGNIHSFDAFLAPVSLAGLPAASVPFGTSLGMPAGLQVISRANAEHTILAVGEALERANRS